MLKPLGRSLTLARLARPTVLGPLGSAGPAPPPPGAPQSPTRPGRMPEPRLGHVVDETPITEVASHMPTQVARPAISGRAPGTLGRTVLLTGASGVVGRALLQRMRACDVVLVASFADLRNECGHAAWRRYGTNTRAERAGLHGDRADHRARSDVSRRVSGRNVLHRVA